MRDQVLARTLDLLRGASRASDRRAVVQQAAHQLGLSEASVYRALKAAGWSSGRKPRKDRGSSAVAVEDLEAVARIMAKGRNKRGQANLPTKEAVEIAQGQGLAKGAGYSQIARRLRQDGLSMVHMRAPEPSISRVSTHPNHVWQVDISVAIQWYLRDSDGTIGQYSDAGARFYEGKRQNLAELRQVLLRYMVTDHYSGAYYVRYYYAPGENSLDVVDFLYRAMAAKSHGTAYPLRGIPRRIVVDQGPAFKAQVVQQLVGRDGLNIELEYHAVKNAKASGAVETRHNHWQRTFEGRLALSAATDLTELNRQAEAFAAVANAERPHTRHGRAPMALWATITEQQLREVPSRDVFLQLATSAKREGVLTNKLHLRADGKTWEIAGAHVHPRQRVQFRLSPFIDQGIRVWDSEDRELAATELQFDQAGFPVNGRRHVWDDDAAQGSSHKPVAAQKLSAEVASDAVAVRLDSVFDDLPERLARHAFLGGQRGQEWQPSQGQALVDSPMLGSIEARERVAAMLGRALTADEGAWWRARVGDGCSQAELDLAIDEFLGGSVVDNTRAELLGRGGA